MQKNKDDHLEPENTVSAFLIKKKKPRFNL